MNNPKATKNKEQAGISLKKSEAKAFYVFDKKTAKEISNLIDVSEKSIGKWVEKYGWRAERDGLLSGNAAINEFVSFLQIKFPSLSAQFQIYALEYYNHKKLIE